MPVFSLITSFIHAISENIGNNSVNLLLTVSTPYTFQLMIYCAKINTSINKRLYLRELLRQSQLKHE